MVLQIFRLVFNFQFSSFDFIKTRAKNFNSMMEFFAKMANGF